MTWKLDKLHQLRQFVSYWTAPEQLFIGPNAVSKIKNIWLCFYCYVVLRVSIIKRAARKQPCLPAHALLVLCFAESSTAWELQHNCSKIFSGIHTFLWWHADVGKGPVRPKSTSISGFWFLRGKIVCQTVQKKNWTIAERTNLWQAR